MPYFRINGIDITRNIAMDGLSLSENDLDAPNSGRTLDALMRRVKVAEKDRGDIKLWPVKKAYLDTLLPQIRNQYVTVETDLIPARGEVTLTMYCSTRKYGVAVIDTQNEVWYKDTTFNVIEQ